MSECIGFLITKSLKIYVLNCGVFGLLHYTRA